MVAVGLPFRDIVPFFKAMQAGLKLRSLARNASPVCLNLGCGNRILPGWINIDISAEFTPAPDVVLDLTHGMPLSNECVDYILAEDFIEHIDQSNGKRFLQECYRILKPTGVMRLLTPDLRTFALAYINRSDGFLEFYATEFGATTFGEMFNLGMRAWGHTFLYDEETLLKSTSECGFTVRRVSFGESEEPLLRGVDLRNSNDGGHIMYLELRKL